MSILLALTATALSAAPALPQQTVPIGANLERFDYPYPVQWFEAASQGATVRMAYLDVAPTIRANGRTAVLLHGKNFCAATWGETIRAMAAKGYRVIAPDQVGFCKSSKPNGYQYSFHAMAALTAALLEKAGVERISLIGHSTGGILASRFALMMPDRVEHLVLVNPLGLTDPLTEGVPYADLGTLLAEEAKTKAASIKGYQQRVYYNGKWKPDYDRWVAMLAGQYASSDGQKVRTAQARLSDMIQTQPVEAELPSLKMPVTLIIGETDKTAFRGNSAPKTATPRTVPQAAEIAVTRIPGSKLVKLPTLGHSPQVEDPAAFQRVLFEALAK